MKTHSFVVSASLVVLADLSIGTSAARAQDALVPPRPAAQATSVPRADIQVLTALRAHPLTAGYPITATWKKGAVVLSGVVGTKEVHDVAVRLAIASGSPFRDDLVIDTGLAHAASMRPNVQGIGMSGFATLGASSPYIYPPPLMGRLDDPFFGFVPPLVSFPPWWRRPNRGTGDVASGSAGGESRAWGLGATERSPGSGWIECTRRTVATVR